jgi:two-component system cell cycle response regulator
MRTAWEQDLTVGVDFMDDEHHDMIAVLTELGTAASGPDGTHIAQRTKIRLVLERLRTLTASHFTHEEQVMRSRGYPLVDGHVAKHVRFLEELDELRARQAAGEENMAARVVAFMQIWFARHTESCDRPLCVWLFENYPDAAEIR